MVFFSVTFGESALSGGRLRHSDGRQESFGPREGKGVVSCGVSFFAVGAVGEIYDGGNVCFGWLAWFDIMYIFWGSGILVGLPVQHKFEEISKNPDDAV